MASKGIRIFKDKLCNMWLLEEKILQRGSLKAS